MFGTAAWNVYSWIYDESRNLTFSFANLTLVTTMQLQRHIKHSLFSRVLAIVESNIAKGDKKYFFQFFHFWFYCRTRTALWRELRAFECRKLRALCGRAFFEDALSAFRCTFSRRIFHEHILKETFSCESICQRFIFQHQTLRNDVEKMTCLALQWYIPPSFAAFKPYQAHKLCTYANILIFKAHRRGTCHA